jgi:hypothetical protein
MSTPRRELISQLFHAALQRPSAERSAFLREACEDDPDLQKELESLLPYDVAAARVLDTAASHRSPSNTDRNLLFAVLALQADVLDADQFVKGCLLWTSRKHVAIGDLLTELGWITPIDRADVERLVDRKVKRHGGDPKAELAAVAVIPPLKRSLAALQDEDIKRSLADLRLPMPRRPWRSTRSKRTVPSAIR